MHALSRFSEHRHVGVGVATTGADFSRFVCAFVESSTEVER